MCEFDRANGTARVTQLAFLLPYRRAQIPLSRIWDVIIVRQTEPKRTYSPALLTGDGSDIVIGKYAKEEAVQIVKIIRAFLSPAQSDRGVKIFDAPGPFYDVD